MRASASPVRPRPDAHPPPTLRPPPQYSALSAPARPGPESARAVRLSPPAGSNARLGQPVQTSNAAAPAQDARGAQPSPPGAGADPNDRTWFTAAMLHGVDRYRDARRTQDSEQPSVDRTE